MNIYITSKTDNPLDQAKDPPAVSIWCVGHIMDMTPKRSLQELTAIQQKWDARKQRRILVEKVEGYKIVSNPKKL